LSRTERTGQDLLLAHVQLLSSRAPTEPPERRLAERLEPALVALLVRALRIRQAAPRAARRL